ncbi:type II toxin-antitoxin system HicA family toxin [bacterium]|nr:type II toxin-antitoxin system HicA family toxin [FCB group bacterium]MBL7191812.1 type II toxin-antitoxin system HicA family toxin [bacterium]
MSPKLPITTPAAIIKALQRGGFYVHHQTGSHIYLKHPNMLNKRVTVPFHRRDLSKGTIKSILKQAGLTVGQLKELM